MEALLPQLLSFPPPPHQLSDREYDRQIKALVQLLHETSASKLAKGVAGGGDLLDVRALLIYTLSIANIITDTGSGRQFFTLPVYPPSTPWWFT